MKAFRGLPIEPGKGGDFDIGDILRVGSLADLIDDLRSRDDAYIAVISSDGESCRISTLGDISRLELLGLLDLAGEAISEEAA